ncbi:hypothetical protein R4Z09_26110 [Niallia oryzisoli]|uniref:Uncharacterized protein n=1 Tax=Niallia oryzisoli TaxID=1737571 RepID=A0ABZ2CFC3_9BACI
MKNGKGSRIVSRWMLDYVTVTAENSYKYRSTLVYGQYLKGKDEDLVDISKGLNDSLRQLIV